MRHLAFNTVQQCVIKQIKNERLNQFPFSILEQQFLKNQNAQFDKICGSKIPCVFLFDL
jgi:hypothetical protein